MDGMEKKMRSILFTASAFCALAVMTVVSGVAPVRAHEFKAGGIRIDHPWARPTAGEIKVGAAYFILENKTADADKLLEVKTDIAGRVELHDIEVKDGFAKMFQIKQPVAIPANGTVAFAPRGKHVMLMGLKEKLQEGQSFPMTLVFEKSGAVDVVVKIENPTDDVEKTDHSDHKGHDASSSGKTDGHRGS